jgi:uncharacterized RmlC-like cupin family protein
MTNVASPWEQWDKEYREFQEREGIPVHTGLSIDDVRTVDVEPWDRTGANGAFVNLFGMEGTCDIQILEIPPEERIKPQRHLFDALVFVITGNGFTTLGTGDDQQTFEWNDNAFFYLPKNTQYIHTNVSDEPTRLLVQTPLPFLYSLLKADELIWENESYSEWEAVSDREDRYSTVSELKPGEDGRRWYWESNFVPDALALDLKDQSFRGGGSTNARFPFRDSAMWSHISEFPQGRYKKAHRHLCGANVLMISGSGYSLLWQEDDDEPTRIDWSPYSLFTPPMLWFHQHFNTSADPARYLVFHSSIQGTGVRGGDNEAVSPRAPSNEIEYHQEDTKIREMFAKELKNEGRENEMDPEIYTN